MRVSLTGTILAAGVALGILFAGPSPAAAAGRSHPVTSASTERPDASTSDRRTPNRQGEARKDPVVVHRDARVPEQPAPAAKPSAARKEVKPVGSGNSVDRRAKRDTAPPTPIRAKLPATSPISEQKSVRSPASVAPPSPLGVASPPVSPPVTVKPLVVQPPRGSTLPHATARASAQWRTPGPALVILDLNLPALDGETIARELWAMYGQTLGVVFVSANDDVREVSRRVVADGWLAKPFTVTELRGAVQQAFGSVVIH